MDSQTLNNLTSKLSSQSIISETNAVDIHKRIYHDFPFPGQSRANKTESYFKSKDGDKFLAKYDEPTYLTFRLNFVTTNYDTQGKSSWGGFTQYDDMPHPLLIKSDMIGRTTDSSSGETIKDYSASDYLKNSLGEEYRAQLLEEFITGLTDITTKYPYYFTSIDGLSDLFKVDPKLNRRLKPDTTITINCIEALDLRITQLLNLYRKVAWDDVYQRWILPDMMRFFKMEIYISELRIFHTTKASQYDTKSKSSSSSTYSALLGELNSSEDTEKFITMAGDALNELMPTIKLELTQCEFDMSDSMSYLNTLKSSKHNDVLQPKIKIKVGNVKETHLYGLNRDVDKIITEANNTGKFNVSNLETAFYNDYISDDLLLTAYNTNNESDYLKNAVKSEIKSIEGGLANNTAISSSLTRKGVVLFDSSVDSKNSYKKNWTQNTASGVLGNLAKNTINEQLGNVTNLTEQAKNKLQGKLQDAVGNSNLGNKLSSAARMLGMNAMATTASLLNTYRSSIYSNTALKDIIQIYDTAVNLPNELLRAGLNEIYKLARIDHKTDTPVMKEIQYMIDNNMTGDEMSKHIDDLISKEELENIDKPEYKEVGEPYSNYTKKTTIDGYVSIDDLNTDKTSDMTPIGEPNSNYEKSDSIDDIIDKDSLNNLDKPELREIGEPNSNSEHSTDIGDLISDEERDKKNNKELTPIENVSPEYIKETSIDDIIDKDKINNLTKPDLHEIGEPNSNSEHSTDIGDLISDEIRDKKNDKELTEIKNVSSEYVKPTSIDDIIDKKTLNNSDKPELREIGNPTSNTIHSTNIENLISEETLNKKSDKELTPVESVSGDYEKATSIDELISKEKLNNIEKPKMRPIGKPTSNYTTRGLINPKYIN